jgi:zinc transporter 1/2/3
MFHQLFEGLSLGVRIASLPSSRDGGSKQFPLFELTLSILFAITTPFGIGIGLLSFTKGTDSGAFAGLVHTSSTDAYN